MAAVADLPGGSQHGRGIELGNIDGDGDLDAHVANELQPSRLLTNDGPATSPSPICPADRETAGKSRSVTCDGAVPPVDADGLPNIDLTGLLPDMWAV